MLNKLKTILTLTLIALTCLALFSCVKNNGVNQNGENSEQGQSQSKAESSQSIESKSESQTGSGEQSQTYEIILSTENGEEKYYFENTPTLNQVIERANLTERKDDFIWSVLGNEVVDFNEEISQNATVNAKLKRIGAVIVIADENGETVTVEPTKESCKIGDKATIGELLSDFDDYQDYSWQAVYKDENGDRVSKAVSFSDQINFVKSEDFETCGYYKIELYGEKVFSIKVTASKDIINEGYSESVFSYGEPTTLYQVLEDFGVDLDVMQMDVTIDYGDRVEIPTTLSWNIESSCVITVKDIRPCVTVQWTNSSGQIESVVFILPTIRRYTTGQAVADAGFVFTDFYWEISKFNEQSSSYETTALTSENVTLRGGEIIYQKIADNVKVTFKCEDLGFADEFVCYQKNSVWQSPTPKMSSDVKKAFTFKGWSLKKRSLFSDKKQTIITSVADLFAVGVENVNLYPAIEVNYDNIIGWFYAQELNAYLHVTEKNYYYVYGADIGYNDSCDFYAKGGKVYLKTLSDYYENKEFCLNFNDRPTGPIVRIRVDDQTGSNVYIFEGTTQLKSYMQRSDLVLKSLNCDGEQVSVSEIEDGKFYSAYFVYYAYA
ncbi:MAG: hypothetical protein IJW64_01070 [Clostridia bacterium]|nr:hypothetical protein [Clostridia bacterium]